MILGLLADAPGEMRYSELHQAAFGLSSKMLCSKLRDLVRDGLVLRRTDAGMPPRVYYRLSDLGQSLQEPLAALQRWAESNASSVELARRSFGADGGG